MADAESPAEAFDRFIDALMAGGVTRTEESLVSAELAETARELVANAGVHLSGAIQRRVWTDLMSSVESGCRVVGDEMSTTGVLHVPTFEDLDGWYRGGHSHKGRWRPVDRLWSSATMRAAIAGCLVIALLGGWFGTDVVRNRGNGRFGSSVPAPVALQATPSPEAAGDRVLLSTTLDREQLPVGPGFILMLRNTAEPGSRHVGLDRGERGAIVYLVESGTATFEPMRQAGRIVRGATGGSPSEEVAPPSTPVQIGAGDVLIVPAQPLAEGNTGTEPATYVVILILEDIGPPTESNPDNVGVITGAPLQPQPDASWPFELPDGPVRLDLRLTTLEPGAKIVPPADGIHWVAQATGERRMIVMTTALEAISIGDAPVQAFVLTLTPVAGSASPVASPET